MVRPEEDAYARFVLEQILAGLGVVNGSVNVVKTIMPLRQRAADVVAQDSEWLTLGGSDPALKLSTKDLSAFVDFLRSPEIVPILQFLATVLLLENDVEREVALTTIGDEVKARAIRWGEGRNLKWIKQWDRTWRIFLTRFDRAIPQNLPAETIEALETNLGLQAMFFDDIVVTSGLLQRIAGILGDIDMLSKCLIAQSAIKRAIGESGIMMFSHLEMENHLIDRDSLYVDRGIVLTPESIERGSDEYFMTSSIFRCVILGTPGAGKSTLVEHLGAVSAVSPSAKPMVIMRARDYARSFWEKSIDQALHETLHLDYALNIEKDVFQALMVLGNVTVVIDGLDEVIEPNLRAIFATRLNRFVVEYPYISVLVTSRKVGYGRAPLRPDVFATAELREYSSKQILEYTSRWFEAIGQARLRDPFLSELASVNDIASNPLMLSLLCSLYRAQGHIPTNRRTVYRKCADLLFWHWDRRRQITQHEDLPDYGDKIMQQIAKFVLRTQAAQGGVEERQLLKIISVFLEGELGARDSERRAQSFLDFCAERAWLLVKVGSTSRGEPLFGFAHRTFMEFFAAEALVRSADDAKQVATEIMKVYGSDPSSSIPELMIQGYDFRTERGASKLMRIIESEAGPDLLLRLMNISMSRSSRSSSFSVLRDKCVANGTASRGLIAALVNLYEDPREQFIEEQIDSGSEEFHALLLLAWSSWVLSGNYTASQSHWQERFLQLARGLYLGGKQPPLIVLNWALSTDSEKGWDLPAFEDLLVCASSDGPVLGAIFQPLGHPSVNGADPLAIERVRTFAMKSFRLGHVVHAETMAAFPEGIFSKAFDAIHVDVERDLTLAISISLLFIEFGYSNFPLIAKIREKIGLNLAAWSLQRLDADGYGNYIFGTYARLEEPPLGAWPKVVGLLRRGWGKEWREGAHSLLVG